MTPSLEIGNGNWAVKSDSLLGYKTIDGKYYPREMSVVRATTATRVNAEGLVELVPYNLLQYSEQFNNAAWTTGAFNATVTANTTISPDGTQNADTIVFGAAGYLYQLFAITGLASATFSIYSKSATQIIIFGGASPAGTDVYTSVNVGNGWFRQILTRTFTGGGTGTIQALPFGNNITAFIWGAQLVEGSEPLDYLPTTDRLDIARIDYSTGEAALLVEPQRTNLLLRSEEFDNAIWSKISSGNGVSPIVTANAGVAPNGSMTADRVQLNQGVDSGGDDFSILRQVVSPVNGTASVWVKSYSGLSYTVDISADGNSVPRIVTSEWQRFDEFKSNASRVHIGLRNSLINNTADILVWGAQVEAGAYPTSYIPTTSASVTRNRDVISSTIPSILNASSGTLFVDAFPVVTSAFNQTIASINDGTTSRGFWLVLDNGVLQVGFRNAGGIFAADSSFSITNLQRIKIALTWNGSAITLFANGVKRIDNLSLGAEYPSTINTIQMQGDGSFFAINRNFINSMALYPIPLSDTELINLTTI
jgi:hypothetical protein